MSDHLYRVIEYESRLSALRLDGDNLIQYFQDNSHAKEARRRMLLNLKDEVATAPIKTFYRESILNEINRYLDILDGNTSEKESDANPNSNYDFLNNIVLPLLTGIFFGYTVNKETEKFMDDSARKLAESIIENMKQQIGETVGNR